MYWSRFFQIIGFGFFSKNKFQFFLGDQWVIFWFHFWFCKFHLSCELMVLGNTNYIMLIVGKTSYHMMWPIPFIYHNTCYTLFLWVIKMFIGWGLSTIAHSIGNQLLIFFLNMWKLNSIQMPILNHIACNSNGIQISLN